MDKNTYINIMTDEIYSILQDKDPIVYLTGSCTTGDFKEGWSDIDILCLTKESISPKQADELLYLRQKLSSRNRSIDYMRLFEGGFLSIDAFLNGQSDLVVYWGTSGERITERYVLNAMSLIDLLDNGILLCGVDIRDRIERPSEEKIKKDIETYYKSIVRYSQVPSKSLYSAGFMLDISRCLYTLETGKIVPKTKAGEIAIEKGWCPDKTVMEKVLEVRNNPLVYSQDEIVKDWLATLPCEILRFAQVLKEKLDHD